ncbi:FKBP-type peptidyl-prolyl cis-trans isomerase N-terminal domain-containing protein [Bacteroidota bacterium]
MKIKSLLFIVTVVAVLFSSCSSSGQKNVKLNTEIDSVSYAIGIGISNSLRLDQGIEKINPELFAQAIEEVIYDKELSMNQLNMNAVLGAFSQKLQMRLQQQNPQDTLAQQGDLFSGQEEIDSVSFYLGVYFGNNYKNAGMDEFNVQALTKAVYSVYNDEEYLISIENSNLVLDTYFNKLQAVVAEKNLIEAEKNLEEGIAFLEKNKKEDGVVSLENGMQYKVLKEGTGRKPSETDEVTVHYHGTLIDGTIFDSSVDRGTPASFPVNGVIQGWVEILQLMPVGSKWKVFIPGQLAYGERFIDF